MFPKHPSTVRTRRPEGRGGHGADRGGCSHFLPPNPHPAGWKITTRHPNTRNNIRAGRGRSGRVDRGGLCGFLLLWFLSPPFSFLLQIYIYFPPKQTTQQQKSVVKTPEKQTYKQRKIKFICLNKHNPTSAEVSWIPFTTQHLHIKIMKEEISWVPIHERGLERDSERNKPGSAEVERRHRRERGREARLRREEKKEKKRKERDVRRRRLEN